MSKEEQITRAIERKIDEYHQRFLSPSAATVKRWRRQEARKLDRKNQLSLPLVFPDDPRQMSLFEQGE